MHPSDCACDKRPRHGMRVGLQHWALPGIALCPATSMAHHVMDGALPTTFTQGVLSGLAHPIIGLDHFLFVIALGMLCWRMNLGWRAAASFVGASLVGLALHLGAIDVPRNESLVALSLVALGACLYAGWRGPRTVMTITAAIAGVFHGYAYGESIIGAESGVLVAYLVGLIAIQSLVGAAAYQMAKTVARRMTSGPLISKWLGALVSLSGAGFLLVSLV